MSAGDAAEAAEAADSAGTGGDVLEGPPFAFEQDESAFAETARGARKPGRG
ncbi:hypothetical protein [Streptosporangium oxazolinicum]|uniref:hypothetical protein n=1 Tax=Streptosporangium oxazolinicum TaxID=909287 RepID=UPI0031E5EFD5